MATRIWPRRAGWLSPRLIGTAAILPALLVAGRGIYTEAWLIFAMGLACWLTPRLERHAGRLAAVALVKFSDPSGDGPDPGGPDLRSRPNQAVA